MGYRRAAVLVGIVLFVLFWAVFRRDDTSTEQEASNPAADGKLDGSQQTIQPQPTGEQRELDTGAVALEKRERSAERQSVHVADLDNLHNIPKLGPVVPVRAEDLEGSTRDASGTGRKFPVSKSVQVGCDDNGVSVDCDTSRRLDEFSQEVRDAAWASKAENLLRELIDRRNPDFTIRNVECRLVTCVMEVASSEGHLNPRRNLQYEDWFAVQARPYGYLLGFETDATGRRITVTLQIYERIR